MTMRYEPPLRTTLEERGARTKPPLHVRRLVNNGAAGRDAAGYHIPGLLIPTTRRGRGGPKRWVDEGVANRRGDDDLREGGAEFLKVGRRWMNKEGWLPPCTTYHTQSVWFASRAMETFCVLHEK